MHPKILAFQSHGSLNAQTVLNLVNRRLFDSTRKHVPYKGKQWMLLTASYSKEGPSILSTSFKGGQKVMAIRR